MSLIKNKNHLSPILFSFFTTFALLAFTLPSTTAQSTEDKCKLARTIMDSISISEKEYSENIRLAKQAAPLWKDACDWYEYLDCFAIISVCYYYDKEYEKFRNASKKLSEVAINYFGENSLEYTVALTHEALRYELASGQYKKSAQLQNLAFEIRKSSNAESEKLMSVLDGIGLTYMDMGDFNSAIEYFNQAISYCNQNSNDATHYNASLISQKAKCFLKKNEIQQSLKLYSKAQNLLNTLPANIPYYAYTKCYNYLDLAEINLSENNTQKAKENIQKALDLYTQDFLQEYKLYLTLGDIQLASEEYKQALNTYKIAFKKAENEYSHLKKHPSFAQCLYKLAILHKEKGELIESLKYSQDALKKISFDFESDDYTANPSSKDFILKIVGVDILALKADILSQLFEDTKNLDFISASQECYLNAANLIQSIRQDYLADGSKHTLAEKVLQVYEKSISNSLLFHELEGDKKHLENAYSFAEANKSILLYESLKNKEAKSKAEIPDSLLEKENELRYNSNFYHKLITEEKQKKGEINLDSIKAWERLKFESKTNLTNFIQRLEMKYPAYLNQKRNTTPADLDAVRKALPDNQTVLVEYMIGKEKGFIFFITKNTIQAAEIDDVNQLAKQISEFRQFISSPPRSASFSNDLLTFNKLSHDLYNNLISPGISQFPTNTDKLIIVPDDILSSLPFEVLLMKSPEKNKATYSTKKQEYLFEKYAISYQYSASLMNTLQGQTSPSKDQIAFLGMAPSFGEDNIGSQRTCSPDMLYSLQCNQKEVKSIQNLIPGKTLLAQDANLNSFVKDATHTNILHLATHACVNESNADLSKIYFTDSSLTLLELDNLHLSSNLTVLSACNTGTGKLLKGEGVMSMTRGFMLAGSKSVVTSLWSVDDCATSDIMIYFYEGLKNGKSKDAALQQAKLKYLSSADKNGQHPYYWAAFVQFGQIDPIQDMTSSLFSEGTKWFAAALLLGLIFWIFRKKKNET